MALYTDHVLPRITNVALATKDTERIRRRVCVGLRGDAVELGFGSGLNIPLLPETVTGLWAVDPSGVAMKLAAKRIAASPVPVHAAGLDGARLDLPDDRFDAALSTFTLCTIPDVASALAELYRVMKPGAAFHFAEHGRSPDDKIMLRQERFNGIQKKIAGGCHLNREIHALIENAGFTVLEIDTFPLPGAPKTVTSMFHMYVGRAQKE